MKLKTIIQSVKSNGLYYTLKLISKENDEYAFVRRITIGNYEVNINEKFLENKFVFRNLLIHELGHILNRDIDDHIKNELLLKQFIENSEFKDKYDKLIFKKKFIHHVMGVIEDILINDYYLGDLVMEKFKDLGLSGWYSKGLGLKKSKHKQSYYYPVLKKIFEDSEKESEENELNKILIVIPGFDNNDQNRTTEEDNNEGDGESRNKSKSKSKSKKPTDSEGEDKDEENNESSEENSEDQKKKSPEEFIFKKKIKEDNKDDKDTDEGNGSSDEESSEKEKKDKKKAPRQSQEELQKIAQELVESIVSEEAAQQDDDESSEAGGGNYIININPTPTSIPKKENQLFVYLRQIFRYYMVSDYRMDRYYLFKKRKSNGAIIPSRIKAKTTKKLMNSTIIVDISGSMDFNIVKVVVNTLAWIGQYKHAHPDSGIIYCNHAVQLVQKISKNLRLPDDTDGGTTLSAAFDDKYIDKRTDNIVIISDMYTDDTCWDKMKSFLISRGMANKKVYGVGYDCDENQQKIVASTGLFHTVRYF